MRVPSVPPGWTQATLGLRVMRWGTGDEAARERALSITREELEAASVTLEMARAWREFYEAEKRRNAGNPSAAGRAELMQRAVTLLEG